MAWGRLTQAGQMKKAASSRPTSQESQEKKKTYAMENFATSRAGADRVYGRRRLQLLVTPGWAGKDLGFVFARRHRGYSLQLFHVGQWRDRALCLECHRRHFASRSETQLSGSHLGNSDYRRDVQLHGESDGLRAGAGGDDRGLQPHDQKHADRDQPVIACRYGGGKL